MKKFILSLIALTFITCASAQSTVPRFGTKKNEDNTGRVLTYAYLTPAPTATMLVGPDYYSTTISVQSLTISPTFSFVAGNGKVVDNVTIYAGATTQQTLTIAGAAVVTGTASTIVVGAGKKAILTFMYDGTKYIERGRVVQP